MAYLAIVVESSNESIADLNELHSATNSHEAIAKLRNYLDAALAGAKDVSFEVTSRDTDPSVSTSGTGSQQETYNLK